MIEILVIGLLFLSALGYLSYIVYKSFTSKDCSSGCGCASKFKPVPEKR